MGRRLWWSGIASMAMGYVLIGVSLGTGNLVLVEPLIAANLIFALPAAAALVAGDQHRGAVRRHSARCRAVRLTSAHVVAGTRRCRFLAGGDVRRCLPRLESASRPRGDRSTQCAGEGAPGRIVFAGFG